MRKKKNQLKIEKIRIAESRQGVNIINKKNKNKK